jgi:hypothetical protein
MTRRVIMCELDARLDNPERRQFAPGFVASIARARASIVSDTLCIWRWGRLNPDLAAGQPCGSFEQWAQWVRDPLVALGCVDPIARQEELKKRDPRRQKIAAVFNLWWDKHQNNEIIATEVHDDIQHLIDPPTENKKEPSRQRIANYLVSLEGTQLDGFRFSVIRTEGKWSVNKYQLTRPDGTTPASSTAAQTPPPAPAAPQVPLADEPAADADPREPGDDREFVNVDDDVDENDHRNPSPPCAQCGQPIGDDQWVQSWFGGYQWDLHKGCLEAWRKRYRIQE